MCRPRGVALRVLTPPRLDLHCQSISTYFFLFPLYLCFCRLDIEIVIVQSCGGQWRCGRRHHHPLFYSGYFEGGGALCHHHQHHHHHQYVLFSVPWRWCGVVFVASTAPDQFYSEYFGGGATLFWLPAPPPPPPLQS